MKEYDLEAVLKRARQRDEGALAILCERYYPKVLKYMYYRAGPDAAEDLAGEVIVKLMRFIDRQNGSFEPWLYRIARNVLIDRARYMKSRPETALDEEMLKRQADRGDEGESVARRLDIQQALARLTGEQRELLTLKFMQGLTNAEISEVTGRRPGAIRALQFRALSALRDLLTHGGNISET